MKTSSSIVAYAAGHFLVDFSCGYILFSMSASGALELVTAATLFLVYNILAFGTQFLLGFAADRIHYNGRLFAVAGCAACAVGLIVGVRAPVLCTVLMGLGNSAFHVGGGIDCLSRDAGFTRAGMFVSTGALGLALGSHFGEEGKPPMFLVFALLIFAALAIFQYCTGARREEKCLSYTGEKSVSNPPSITAVGMSATLILFAVLIRSWVGFIAPNAGSESKFAFLLPPAAAFAGKLIGGALADIFGARKVSTLALLASIPLFFVGTNHFIIFVAAVFFFNLVMPVTLVELARRFPGHEGFAFGLCSLAILLGYLGATLLPISDGAAKHIVVFLAFIAAGDVYFTSSDDGAGLNK